jgi:GNAT superfamily N-acetyltransferase
MDPEAGAVGFVEAAVHMGPKGPYGHVEGWYVMPELRGRGHGWALIHHVENWCLHRAICLLTSDTDPAYALSPGAQLVLPLGVRPCEARGSRQGVSGSGPVAEPSRRRLRHR